MAGDLVRQLRELERSQAAQQHAFEQQQQLFRQQQAMQQLAVQRLQEALHQTLQAHGLPRCHLFLFGCFDDFCAFDQSAVEGEVELKCSPACNVKT